MKTAGARRSRAHHGNGHGHGAEDPAPHGATGMLAQFAAERAHLAADALYEHTKARIDRAHREMSQLRVDSAWDRLQPALVGAAGFVRHYPLRAALVAVLLGGAYWLTRVNEPGA